MIYTAMLKTPVSQDDDPDTIPDWADIRLVEWLLHLRELGFFDEEGNCTDEAIDAMLKELARETVSYIQRHVCPAHVLESRVRADEDAEPWSTNL